MPDKKPFSETKVGSWIKNNAPGIIGTIEKFVPAPISGGLDIIKNLIAGQPDISPEKLAEFNKLAADFELELIRLHNDEMANARNREIEITKATGKRDINLTVLAWFGVLAPILILFYLLIFGFPKLDKEIALMIGTLIGYIFSEYKTIYGYFFGSSSGSKNKQDTIDTMMKQE